MPLPGAVPSVLRPAVRRLLLPGSASGPVLLARYIYPNADGSLAGLPTTSRATVSPMYADASGDLVQYAANNVAISNGDSVACWPGYTNLCADSRDFEGVGWSYSNASGAQDAVGIDGVVNTAWTITDSDGTNSGYVLNTVGGALSSVSGTHSIRWFIKKESSASTYPVLFIRFTGGTVVGGLVTVDHVNGILSPHTSAPDAYQISSSGNFWKVTLSHAEHVSGNTSINGYLYPSGASSPTATALDVSAQGSCVVDQVDIFLETSNAIAHARGPIPTAGSSVAVDPSEPVVPWPSGLVNDFCVVVDLAPSVSRDDQSCYFFGLYSNIQNRLHARINTNDNFQAWIEVGDSVSELNINAVSFDYASGDALKIWFLKTQTRFKAWLSVNGTIYSSTESTNAIAKGDIFTPPANLAVGDWQAGGGGTSGQFIGTENNLRIIKVAPNITDAEVLAL